MSEQFLKVYEDFADPIFRHCWFRISDREKAKDLMQETFTKTWQYLANGGEVKNMRAFLYRTANNLIIDEYRKKKPESLDLLLAEGFDPVGENAAHVERRAEAGHLMLLLRRLDEKYGQPILMKYLDDIPVKDIAEILNETENVISVRIHRGLKQLKEILEHENNV